MGARHASHVLAAASDEQQRATERRVARDAAMRHAQFETALIRFDTGTMQATAQMSAEAVKQPPAQMVPFFDAQAKALEGQLDQFNDAEDPRIKARAESTLYRHVANAREHLSNYAAGRTADDAKAAIIELQQSLEESVASGSVMPADAVAQVNSAITAQSGVTINTYDAAKLKESLAGQMYARGLEPLFQRSDTDPEAAKALRTMLNSPEALRYFAPDSRRRMLDSLDARQAAAEEVRVHDVLAAGQRAAGLFLPNGREPMSFWLGRDPESTRQHLEGIVQTVMSTPGWNATGTLVKGRNATESDVRALVGIPMLEASAAAGDQTGFELAQSFLSNVNSEDLNALPSVDTAEKIAQARHTLEQRIAGENYSASNARSVGAAYAHGASAFGDPAFRDKKAIDQWAARQYATDPTATLGSIGRFAITNGAPLPSLFTDAIERGFGDGATTDDTMAAAQALRQVRQVDALAAERAAHGSKHDLAAVAMMNMPAGIAPDEQLAGAFFTPEGEAALKFAFNSTANAYAIGGDGNTAPFTIDQLSATEVLGVPMTYSQLSPTARREFDAAFAYRLAKSGAVSGDIHATPANKEAATEAAKAAMLDVGKSQASVHLVDSDPNADWAFSLYDGDRQMMVDPHLYGLKMGEAVTADKPFAKFLDEGRSYGGSYFGRSYVRPDLGFVSDWNRDDALRQTVMVPVMDSTGTTAVAFLKWNPITQAGEAPVTGGREFEALRTKLGQNSSALDRDPMQQFRAPNSGGGPMPSMRVGALWMNDLQGNDWQAERFKTFMEHEYMVNVVDDTHLSLAEYLDARAQELGWAGFARPKPPETQQ